MRVGKGRKEDFVEVHKLLLNIFPNARADFGEKDEFFVARHKELIIGFAHFLDDGRRIILKGLGVAEGWRKKGIGRALLDEVVAHGKRKKLDIYLKTKVRNPALRLYCKAGFCFKRIKGEVVTMVYKAAN